MLGYGRLFEDVSAERLLRLSFENDRSAVELVVRVDSLLWRFIREFISAVIVFRVDLRACIFPGKSPPFLSTCTFTTREKLIDRTLVVARVLWHALLLLSSSEGRKNALLVEHSSSAGTENRATTK